MSDIDKIRKLLTIKPETITDAQFKELECLFNKNENALKVTVREKIKNQILELDMLRSFK